MHAMQLTTAKSVTVNYPSSTAAKNLAENGTRYVDHNTCTGTCSCHPVIYKLLSVLDTPGLRSVDTWPKTWQVEELCGDMIGEDVLVRGRVHLSRVTGKQCFLKLRHRYFSVQVTVFMLFNFYYLTSFILGVSLLRLFNLRAFTIPRLIENMNLIKYEP